MTSKSAFTYPVPHSTFIPISHRSVSPNTYNQSSRKRKRAKSSTTNIDEEENEDGEGIELRTPSPNGLAGWTSVNPHMRGSTTPNVDYGYESTSEEQRKKLGSNFEQRIRK